MRPFSALALGLLLAQQCLCALPIAAQQDASSAQSSEPTFRISSNLVLLDVEALNAKNGLPIGTLKRDDFTIFDDGQPVPIATFDAGTSARPLALWFVVLCNMHGWESKGSGLFSGQVARFRPALERLARQDTVAVAEWCDDGQSRIVAPPASDIGHASAALEQALAPVPDTASHDRSGELALQKTLQLIVDSTRSLPRESIPAVIFLYGDYSGMPRSEADGLVDQLLRTSAIAYGLRDTRSPRMFALLSGGEQDEIAKYIVLQTGGEYLRVTPDNYAAGLEQILDQLHSRYELGFKPQSLDGKRHKLRVELADDAKNKRQPMRLRYRTAYIPISATK